MSLAKFIQVADCPDLPPDLRQWLQGALRLYIDGEPLEPALNISTDDRALDVALRNRHLQQAAKHLEATNPWPRAVALAENLKRFESIIWPRWKFKAALPQGTSQIYRHLFAARRLNRKEIPDSVIQLYRIITNYHPPAQ